MISIQGKPFNITVIQVYAPAIDSEIVQFYEDIQHMMDKTPRKDVTILIGDWNAKVGNQKTPGITGKFGLGVKNEAGQRLAEFCQDNSLVIAKTFFQQPPRRLYTWTSPDGQYRNQIDYILCSQRWRNSIQSAKTRPGADCGSDHELLIAKFRIKLKKRRKTISPIRYDINNIPCEYAVEVKNSFEGLDMDDRMPEELWTKVCNIIQETARKNIHKRKKSKKANWLSDEAVKIAQERRKAKGSADRKKTVQLNAEFQRIARRHFTMSNVKR
ncbi:Hypothetical predicted protein [Pelobates cultripes]|uniref:Endonuclease/exonuclease/phosphatase domain-containing protein n=1 Tax=Pelobates cultripes TaxID=61616 RepID=A0AAD1W1U7_PELCU|nr:Hypothetical predicted protein [Pelobates cultripes]